MVKFITTLMVAACALVFTGEASKAMADHHHHRHKPGAGHVHKPGHHHLSAPIRHHHHHNRVVVVATVRPAYASNYYWSYGYARDPFWNFNLYSGLYSADPYFYQDPATGIWYRYYNGTWFMHRQGAWYRYGGGHWRFSFRY